VTPIQFAFVREDPDVELALIEMVKARSTLLVASGGCTAFAVAAARPAVALTLVDMNAAQLALVEKKLAFLRTHAPDSLARRRAFGCDGVDDKSALTSCGNFESLFRSLRAFLDELVAPANERAELMGPALLERVRANRYWPVAFALFFSDAILEAMFGPDATQHAPKGSYPEYFRRVIERGLARDDARSNAWLQQVLLGYQLVAPAYLAHDFTSTKLELVHAAMKDAPDFARFDVVSLSNLFDWMDESGVDAIARRLRAEARPGTVVVVRQLNNTAPVERAFEPDFVIDDALSRELVSRDRSLFYERIVVLRKR
jgi:S-adenosylmethionine-diacylglycerol 3-amino-3-carboxypropyl transferase